MPAHPMFPFQSPYQTPGYGSWTSGGYVFPTLTQEPPMWNHLVYANSGVEIPLSMQHLSLTGEVCPAGAFLRATHMFKCAGDEPMEAVYIFQLPRGATLRRFIVKGEGFEVESKLSPREEARKEYEAGVQAGHLSTLAEVNTDGRISLAIGQVQPEETVTVIVELVSGVDVQDGGYRFRFPFTLAPNYHSKATMTSTATGGKIELPSDVFGDLILPEWKADAKGLHQISFKIHVEAGGLLDSVASPSHRILVRPSADGSAEVELSGMGDTPNRDLVLDVVSKSKSPMVFMDQKVSKNSKIPQWTIVIPSSEIPKAAEAPREVCFVLDRSGSMAGEPINQAKMALKACLSALSPTDKFGLVHFGRDAVVFDKQLCFATDVNRKRAQKWMDDIHASGGTELANALGEAVSILDSTGKDIFLLTDGQVSQSAAVIETCADCGARIHVMGIGSAAQDRFLSSLARRTNGVQRMVGVNEDVAGAALEMFNAIQQPVQVNVKAIVEMGKGKKDQTHEIGTVWDGKSILITDNGGNAGQVPVQVGLVWGVGKNKVIKLPIKQKTPNGLSAMLWAGRQVEDLESALDMAKAGPSKKALEIKLKDLSMAYGLASQVMSLCAVVKRPGDVASEVKQQIVPVGTPEGMQMFGGGAVTRGINYAYQGLAFASLGLAGSYSKADSMISGNYGATKGVGTRCCLMATSVSNTTSDTARNAAFDTNCLSMDAPDDYDSQSMKSIRGFEDELLMAVTKSAESRKKSATKGVDPSRAILQAIGDLEADGGMPGATQGDRFFKTAFLALAMLSIDVGNKGKPLFTSHLKRMALFLQTFSKAFAGKPKAEATVLALAELVREACQFLSGDWMAKYREYRGDAKAAWATLESSINLPK